MNDEVRTLRSDASRNRDRLMSVALEAFTESGADASLKAIATRAGVGIGTLYRHFPTREALILAVYRREVDHLCAGASELLETLPAEEALRAWMDRLAHYAVTKHGLADALQTAATSEDELFATTYRTMVDAVAALLAANIEAGTVRAGLSPDDVLLAMSGLFHLGTDGDWQAQATRLIDLLITGMRPDQATRTRA